MTRLTSFRLVPLVRLVTLGAALAAGCATVPGNPYRVALSAQDQCCRGLATPAAQGACLAELPRTSDETSPLNRETFQCVAQHFQCDRATGRATRASAQQQLDCLNDLATTQQGVAPPPRT